MMKNELKEQLFAAGATEEQLADIDLEKVESIISGAENINEISSKMKEVFPSFNEAEFRKALTETAKNSEDAEDLSDEALEAVAGGSGGNWFKRNYETILRVAVLTGVLGVGYGFGRVIGNKIAKNSAQNTYAKVRGRE